MFFPTVGNPTTDGHCCVCVCGNCCTLITKYCLILLSPLCNLTIFLSEPSQVRSNIWDALMATQSLFTASNYRLSKRCSRRGNSFSNSTIKCETPTRTLEHNDTFVNIAYVFMEHMTISRARRLCRKFLIWLKIRLWKFFIHPQKRFALKVSPSISIQ